MQQLRQQEQKQLRQQEQEQLQAQQQVQVQQPVRVQVQQPVQVVFQTCRKRSRSGQSGQQPEQNVSFIFSFSYINTDKNGGLFFSPLQLAPQQRRGILSEHWNNSSGFCIF